MRIWISLLAIVLLAAEEESALPKRNDMTRAIYEKTTAQQRLRRKATGRSSPAEDGYQFFFTRQARWTWTVPGRWRHMIQTPNRGRLLDFQGWDRRKCPAVAFSFAIAFCSLAGSRRSRARTCSFEPFRRLTHDHAIAYSLDTHQSPSRLCQIYFPVACKLCPRCIQANARDRESEGSNRLHQSRLTLDIRPREPCPSKCTTW